MVKKVKINEIKLLGGKVCLDFVNTIHDRIHEPFYDYLTDVHALVEWALLTNIIQSEQKVTLEKIIGEAPAKASSFFKEALQLRALLWNLFPLIIQKKAIPKPLLSTFNKYVSAYFSKLQLIPNKTGFIENWQMEASNLHQITAPIIKDAYSLMLQDDLERIKSCPNCGWLFYDGSKNRKRRWCSMTTCGSRVKALQWYNKQKSK
ncbi:MAG: CGNR zinc finger domain-containing protein [Bacteroidota bacterium]